MRAEMILLGLALAMPLHAAEPVIEATTTAGEKVRLLPNGRWEYLDQSKQAEAKKIFEAYPENRDPNAQGALFGVGRSIQPGDKDYNRGTLNPKAR